MIIMKRIILTGTLLLMPITASAQGLSINEGTNTSPPSTSAIEKDFHLTITREQQAEVAKNLPIVENSSKPGIASKIKTSLTSTLKFDQYTKLALLKPFDLPTTGTLTSPYGWRNIGAGQELHEGQDIANAIGTPVYAAGDGIVHFVDSHTTAGNYIVIRHTIDGITIGTRYLHLDTIDTMIGRTVKKGDFIGTMGNTGRSTGPHLHFEVRAGVNYSDMALEPMQFIRE